MHLLRHALPEAGGRTGLTVVCVGNRWRSDDGAGLAVADRLRARLPKGVDLVEREGEPTALIDSWADAEAVWIVDAVAPRGEPGRIHLLDAGPGPLSADLFRTSTHHLSLAEALELARALDRLPARARVVGIEGEVFAVGAELTPAVAAAVDRAAEIVLVELGQ